MTVECDYVLAAIGQSIEWGNLLDGTKVELNRNLTAKADSWTYQTSQDDVFVGGDVYTGPRFAIDAIAAGKEDAESLHRYVWEGHTLRQGSQTINICEPHFYAVVLTADILDAKLFVEPVIREVVGRVIKHEDGRGYAAG